MPKGSAELTSARREEILAACRKLYETMSFKEITLKEIGQQTSFTRTSIYNYFETKEEIFLALFQREYELFARELDDLCLSRESLSLEELASELAHALERRPLMLKLLSMNLYDMEANSRPELLVSFKVAYGTSMQNICRLLQKFCPDMTVSEIQNFIYIFFPFMFGIYPYTAVTDKQRAAMKEANVDYVYQTIYEITYTCLCRLLDI